jgi:uncharacterized protein YyaL (SSP411 family)
MHGNGERYTNKLIDEKSPYLLQHAHNPVDWYPWGDEAFKKAEKKDKPIFLSIGYSTCHWCHVMERESFTDEELAKKLNEVFISIKVDREERPDIDAVYMRLCQLITGGGGWPLTVLMTPDKKPFYIDTYIPKDSRYGKTGLRKLIEEVNRLWETDREHIDAVAGNALQALYKSGPKAESEITEKILQKAFVNLTKSFDPTYGGFGYQPKFPIPHQLLFLLRYWHSTGEAKALEMAETTLRNIRMGGIYDHIAGGIHRYSTDNRWLVPHFEKMLYDQALMAMAYTEAYQATRDEFYKEAAEHILHFVLSELRHPEGGFYSALDAESEGEEGKFYLWTAKEIRDVLGKDATIFMKVYNVNEEGNFLDEATRRYNGKNILYMTKTSAELASETGLNELVLKEKLVESLTKLRAVREKRWRPSLDDKILASWNGLMISALSKAGSVFWEKLYLDSAKEAADFLSKNLTKHDGTLLRRYREGESIIHGFAEDYAYVSMGYISLYSSTFIPEYLETAVSTINNLLANFWDEDRGGFFNTSKNNDDVPVRLKESYDGALPSSNSVAVYNLFQLSRILDEPKMEDGAREAIAAFASQVEDSPESHCFLLLSLQQLYGNSSEVILAGEPQEKDTQNMINTINDSYRPFTILINVSEQNEALFKFAEHLSQYTKIEGKATAYVCKNRVCHQPTTDIKTMLSELNTH